MTTTHDRAYTTEEFPAERKIPRQEDDCDKLPTTTMKQDFGYKQATEIVKPYLPPGDVEENRKTFSMKVSIPKSGFQLV